MGELKMEDMALPALFDQARKLHLAATEATSDQVCAIGSVFALSSLSYSFIDIYILCFGSKDSVKKGIQVLERCDDMVSKLGLFSANETKDDISTTNLKYILVCMCCL